MDDHFAYINQSRVNEADNSERMDLANDSSRITLNDQKKLFEKIDIRFWKDAFLGDNDEYIDQSPLKEITKNKVVEDQDETPETDKIENNVVEFKRISQEISNHVPSYYPESQMSIPSRSLIRNPSYFATNLNKNFRKNRDDSQNSAVVIGEKSKQETYLQNPQFSIITSSRNDKIEKIKQEEQVSRNSNICQNIIKQTMEKPVIDEQILQAHQKNFFQKLKQRYSKRKIPLNMPLSFYKLINDKGSSQAYIKLKRKQLYEKEEQQIVKGFRKFIPVFLPFHTFCLVWDAIQIVISILFMYIYSILIFFAQQQYDSNDFDFLFRAATIFFGLDILLNLNTAYFQKDQMITSLSMISFKYLKTHLVWDVLSFIILFQKMIVDSGYSYNPTNNIFIYLKNIVVFFKIFGLPKKRRNIQNSIILKTYQKHLLRLFDQIFFVVMSAHIVCILWNGLAVLEVSLNFTTNWQQKISIQDYSWGEIYMYSLYWSVTTMSTVGYGDITPSNAIECLFVTASMVFMSCVFAYSINNIGLILQEIEKDSKELNDKLQIIHKFLKMKGVNIELQRRVKHYLQFLSQESKSRSKNEEDIILNMLSNKLREEVLKEINSKVINKCTLFVKNFSPQMIHELTFAIEEILVQPNQIIFKEGEIDEDLSMYFVWNGKIDICYTDLSKQKTIGNKILNTIEGNTFFGELSFFTGLPRSASARSVNLATLYKISRKKILHILSHHFEDFERFKMIEEQLKTQNELQIIGLECYSCKQLGHTVMNCPLNTAYFDKQLIILKSNFSLFQARKKITSIKDQSILKESMRKRQRIHSIQLLELNKTIMKQLKQQAVYLGSSVFKMFERKSDDESGDSDEDDLIENSTKNKSEELITDNSSSSNGEEEEEQTESQSQNSIKKGKIKQKENQSVLFNNLDGQDLDNNNNEQLLPRLSQMQFKNQASNDSGAHQNVNNIIMKVEQINNRLSKQFSNSKSIDQNSKNGSNLNPYSENKNRESIKKSISNSENLKAPNEFNEFCSSLLNLMKCQEKQIQQIFQQNQSNSIKDDPRHLNHPNQPMNNNSSHDKHQELKQETSLSKIDTISNNEVLQDFDRAKIFKRFFPENNLNRVLKKLRNEYQKKNNLQTKNKVVQQQQPRRRANVNIQEIISNQEIKIITEVENQDLIDYINKQKPTYSSYGFFTKKSALHPLRANNN